MLFLFDIDGTLVRSFMREGGGGASQAYDLVEILPGRRERLDALRAEGHHLALVTNQGGVAFGYQTATQVLAKIGRVADAAGLMPTWICSGPRLAWTIDGFRIADRLARDVAPPFAYVSFDHPKAHDAMFLSRPDDDWRKPGPGMIQQARADYGTILSHIVFVGDMDTDRQAAEAAGVLYMDAAEFFGTPLT
jgi:histidinol phosphatase-like enzyme